MDRSLYPDNVEVDHTALANTESTKISEILSRTLAVAQMGVVTGLRVTPNGSNTQRIDIAVGTAYAPNAEKVALSTAAVALALQDNTANVVNYVLLQYTETEALPDPSEDGLAILNTTVVSSGTVNILTKANYDLLSSDDKARSALIAIVVGSGGTIQQSAIAQPDPFVAVLAPSQPTLISGVSISAIDFATQTGDGVLDFDASPASGVSPLIPAPRIRWQAPGEGVPGVYQSISVNGAYTLTSSSGRTLTIRVISVNLPLIDQLETIRVDSLYAIPTPRFTAADYLHRTYLGSGTPSVRNPHGLTFEDLGGSPTGQVEEHQLFMHSNGIRRGSNSIFLFPSVIPVAGLPPDFISITGAIAGDTYTVNGKVLFGIADTQITFLTSVSSSISIYDLMLDEGGHPSRALRLEHPLAPTITGVALVDIDEEYGAGSYNLVYNRTLGTLQFDSGPTVRVRGDGNYTLYNSSGLKVVVNVGVSTNLGFGVLPVSGGPVYTDSITVYDKVSRKINFLLGNVVWDGSNVLGFTELLTNPKTAIDKRLFGTLGLPEIRQDVLDVDSKHAGFTYTVGDGKETFGDFDGPTGIAAALAVLATAGTPGSIFVKAGTYDPFSVSIPDITIVAGAGAIIDGIAAAGTAACVTLAASRVTIEGLQLDNATLGISQVSGNDCRSTSLIFGSGLTTILGYTAGLRNLHTGNKRMVRTLSADTTLTPFDDIVMVDATSAAKNITMPLSTACLRPIRLKKIDVTINAVNVLPSGGETIDLFTSTTFDTYLDSENFEPTGSGWIS